MECLLSPLYYSFHLMETYLWLVEGKENKMALKKELKKAWTKESKMEPMFHQQSLMVWMLEFQLKSLVNCLGDLIFVC